MQKGLPSPMKLPMGTGWHMLEDLHTQVVTGLHTQEVTGGTMGPEEGQSET